MYLQLFLEKLQRVNGDFEKLGYSELFNNNTCQIQIGSYKFRIFVNKQNINKTIYLIPTRDYQLRKEKEPKQNSH